MVLDHLIDVLFLCRVVDDGWLLVCKPGVDSYWKIRILPGCCVDFPCLTCVI